MWQTVQPAGAPFALWHMEHTAIDTPVPELPGFG